jgi:hypothetical protein
MRSNHLQEFFGNWTRCTGFRILLLLAGASIHAIQPIQSPITPAVNQNRSDSSYYRIEQLDRAGGVKA